MHALFDRLPIGRSKAALFVLVALGTLLRFWAIGAKTIWLDEAFSIWVANQPLWDGWGWLIKLDQHPPLYYTLLAIWQALFGDAQGVVRMFSALCSTGAMLFFYLAAKRITRDDITALLATLILALSPFHVRFAQETRMYALLTLLAAAAIYFAARTLDGHGTRRLTRHDWLSPQRWLRLGDVRAAVGLSVTQAGVMLTHNTATIFFPLALNLVVLGAWLYRRRTGRLVALRAVNAQRFLRNWARIQLAALILWLPWAIPFAIQVLRVDREFWIGAPSLGTMTSAIYNFNFAHLPSWIPSAPGMLLYALFALLGIFLLRRRLAWALLLAGLFVIPYAGELLVSLRRPIFYDRTLIWTTMSYYLLIAVGLRGLVTGAFSAARNAPLPDRDAVRAAPGYRVRWALAALVTLLIVAYSTFSLYNYYSYFHKEEWSKAADYIAERVEDDELILFNATWVQLPFESYFREYGIDANFRGLPVDLFDRGILEPKMAEEDVPTLHALMTGEPRVWLVYSHDWYTDPDHIILRELGDNWNMTDHQEFVGLQIFQYQEW